MVEAEGLCIRRKAGDIGRVEGRIIVLYLPQGDEMPRNGG